MRKVFKVLLYIISSLLLLIGGFLLYLQSGSGQRWVTQQVLNYAHKNISEDIRIDRIQYKLISRIQIEGVYIPDGAGQTLLEMGNLELGFSVWGLLKNTLTVNYVKLEEVNAVISRSAEDTVFNFNYIIEQFTVDQQEGEVVVQSKSEEKESKPLIIKVSKVDLNNIHFSFLDTAGGSFFQMELASLKVTPKTIDYVKGIYEVDELSIKGLTSSFDTDTAYYVAPETPSEDPLDLIAKARQLNLEDVQFSMLSKQDSMYMNYEVQEAQLVQVDFDLLKETVNAKSISLEEVASLMIMPNIESPSVGEEEKDSEEEKSNLWKIAVEEIRLNKVNFKMDDPLSPKIAHGMDYSHMDFQQAFIHLENVYYDADSTAGKIKHIALKEQSGLHLMQLKGDFKYTQFQAGIWNMFLETPYSQIQDQLMISYQSFDELIHHYEHIVLDVALKNAKLGMQDILLFMPEDLAKDYKVYQKEQVFLSTQIKGALNDLLISSFDLRGFKETKINLTGKIKGLPNPDQMVYNFYIKELSSSSRDIVGFLPPEIQDMVELPQNFNLVGSIRGGTYYYYPDLILNSSDGKAKIEGYLNIQNEGREQYDLVFSTDQLDLGKILKMEDSVLGKITIEGKAKGTSFDTERLTAHIDAKILAAQAMGYNYHDIVLNTMINQGEGSLSMNSTDPNLLINLTSTINLKNEYPALQANMDIQNIDFFALHLMEDSLRFNGKVGADFKSLNPDYPEGFLSITDGRIIMDSLITPFDSIAIVSLPEVEQQNLYINAANIIFAKMTGKMPLTQIGNTLLAHINRHYYLGDSLLAHKAYPYDMELAGYVTYHPVLNSFLPSLKPFDSISFKSSLDDKTMNVSVDIPKIFFGTNVIDSGYVRIKENPDTFNYAVGLKTFENSPLKMYAPSIRGIIRNDSIYALVNIKDSLYQNQFTLGGSIHQDLTVDSSLTFVKLFSGLRFDYERWEVDPSNQMVLSPQGLLFRHLKISRGRESLSVQSENDHYGAPFNVAIKNFELGNITKMLSSDTLIAEGALSVDAKVDMADPYMKIEATASIDGLKAFSYPLGNLKASVHNPNEIEYVAQMDLRGQGNDINVSGSYYMETTNGNDLNFKVKLNPFSLKSVEGLTFGALKNSRGGLLGNVDISGKMEDPVFNGYLEFFDMNTTVSMLNAPFRFGDDRIYFNKDVLRFDNVRIYDFKNNEASINGTVTIQTFDDIIANLTFRANRWQPIHSTKTENPEFYGDLIMSSNLTIKGDVMAPKLDGNITLHDSTHFTYVMLDTGPGMVDHTGIVKFYDSKDTFYLMQEAARPRRVSRSSSVNVNVDIEKNAKFGLIVDPGTGEGLEVQGLANLNAFMNPDGTIGLTGVYELENGFYELKFNLLTRKFIIQKGSTITLSGDPLDAEANIVAIYKANIAPYDLVEKQAPQEELNFYKQRIPFEVLLKINGKALEPQLTFDIVIPEGTSSGVSSSVESLVQSKLSELRTNPSEMNKQVFAVLLMNRFIAENPFATSTGSMETAAKQTVGRFLSDQLNQIAGNLISGLELNVDLDASEDYSTGMKQNRTDLNISASKRLFNDRVKVTVGNNFELEGGAQDQNSSVIPGNIAIDYDLTRDGKYKVRAYRTNELRNILDGYTVETGVNFRMALEYNRFRYIFINRQKQFERLRARREAINQTPSANNTQINN